MNGQHYTIKQVAQQTGLSAYTLRYYEQFGLIDPVTRADNGHRQYGETDLKRVNFLIRLRHMGMSLDDILHFIELYQTQDRSGVRERHHILSAHREQVQQQIDDLSETLAFIDFKLALYADEIAATDVECDLK